MPKIPFTVRRSGRYYFRRRARWQNICDFTAIVPLRTCDAAEARWRASALASHFEGLKRAVNMQIKLGAIVPAEDLAELFEGELHAKLEELLASFYASDDPDALAHLYKTHAAAFDIAQRPGLKRELSDRDRDRLQSMGLDEADIEWVACDLDRFCHRNTIDEREAANVAEGFGLEPSDAAINMIRSKWLAADAEAYRLASYFLEDDIQDTTDPIKALMAKRRKDGQPFLYPDDADDSLRARSESAAAKGIADEKAAIADRAQEDCPFLIYDPRPFSEIIEPTIAELKGQGRWNSCLDQARRALKTFAWITGDKPLGDYNHLDVNAYKQGLLRLHRDFKFKANWHRPFDEVVAECVVPKGKERTRTTLNRDLSYMSSVSQVLSLTAWKPKVPNQLVLDFPAALTRKKKKKYASRSELSARPPWKTTQMELLFTAPVWTGGGGHLHRFDRPKKAVVYHDAAYWLPLLLYYTHATVNEIAGLRVDEVFLDEPTPFITIKDNDIRGTEEELAGEKNENRGRDIPLHTEILRLNFGAYVSAINAEGHAALFPELYENEAKVGGAQFYNVAWRHMVDWLGSRTTIPRNEKTGKIADMHSIRSLGASHYAQDGVLDLMRADVMGHAREGTNAIHYSKREETEGQETVLREYRDFMMKYTPIVTENLAPSRVRMLPINHRSRTGRFRI